MAFTPEQVRDEMVAGQPPGRALPTDKDSWWVRLLAGLAVEFSRIRGRVDDMRRELNPATTSELLSEWEGIFVLPDHCTNGITLTEPERLARLRAKVAAIGGQSRAYFILLAQRMGLEIEIEEPEPFYCGTHGCGDPIGGLEWRFSWIVHAPSHPSPALRTLFECAFITLKPAHTIVAFSYPGPACPPVLLHDGSVLHDGTIDYDPTCVLETLHDGSVLHDGSITYGA